MHLLQGALEF